MTSNTSRLWEPMVQVARGALLVVFAAALLFYVVSTLHWPMLVDAPVMHYVTFLTEHGFKPYRDITDNNMPGAYLLERAAIFVFGTGDLGWRIYDLFLLAALMVAMIVIAKPYDWLAGVYAAGLFALRHGSEGPWFTGEREQEIAVLLAAGCALLFLAVRRQRPWLACGFGLLTGLAATIKPTFAIFPLLTLLVMAHSMRRRGTAPMRYLLFAGGGLLAAFAVNLLFLVHYGVLQPFWFVLRTVTPVYAGLSHPGLRTLLLHVAPFDMVPILLLGLCALWFHRAWTWERTVVLLASLCGLGSYILQDKGFLHHRYIFVAFGLLSLALIIFPAGSSPWGRAIACAALLYATVYVVPHNIAVMRTMPSASPMTASMEADLRQLGGSRLQGQVQCFDLVLGCLNSLYHLDLVENTGFTGDLLLFPPRPNPATDYYRALYKRTQATHPAGVIVMTNEDFGHRNSFDRMARWPGFADDLQRQYTLAVTRSFPREGRLLNEADAPPGTALAYRIYLRKDLDFPPLQGSREGATP